MEPLKIYRLIMSFGMKLKLEKFQLIITSVVVTFSFTAMLFNLEIYPFAPYTMYSYRHTLNDWGEIELFCVTEKGDAFDITDIMLAPLDEARLKTSLENHFDHSDEARTLPLKLTSVARSLKKKNIPCSELKMVYKRYRNVDEYLSKKGRVLKAYSGYSNE